MFVMNYADVTKILSQHEKKHISAKKSLFQSKNLFIYSKLY